MENEEEMFEYMNEIREDGQINPLGATALMVDRFDLSRYEARDVITAWMQNPHKYA